MLENSYTEPQIYGRTTDHEWFVGFRFFCASRQQSKRPQVRLGINYHQTVKARAAEADNVRQLVKLSLVDGWNPFEYDLKTFLRQRHEAKMQSEAEEAEKQATDPRNFGFNAAMQWAFDKKAVKENTIGGVSVTLKYVKIAAVNLKFDNIPIKEITRFHVCELLDEIRTIRQAEYDISTNKRYKGKRITPNFYNNHLDRLGMLFFEYSNRGIIEYNPCRNIAKKDAIDFGVHRHPTDKEVAIIKEKLPIRHPGLYDFSRFEYVTGMRPDEILDTRFNMVDYLNCCINISDDPYNALGETISKTTEYRQVPVPQFLLDWIRSRQERREPTDYIFSRRLQPGSYRISRTWVSMLWKEIVIDEFGINVSLYSFKGKGGDAKRDAGIELPAVSVGYGHNSTMLAQKKYLQKEGERLRQQIIDHAPDL